jgi:hypothetical protein
MYNPLSCCSSRLDHDLSIACTTLNPAHVIAGCFEAYILRVVMNTSSLLTKRLSLSTSLRLCLRSSTLGISKAREGNLRTIPIHPLASARRLPYSTTSIRMDSIISPEKVLGTSNPPASDLEVQLTAPNGRKYTQPIGLFINNEWVKSSNEQKLASISPMYESTID